MSMCQFLSVWGGGGGSGRGWRSGADGGLGGGRVVRVGRAGHPDDASRYIAMMQRDAS